MVAIHIIWYRTEQYTFVQRGCVCVCLCYESVRLLSKHFKQLSSISNINNSSSFQCFKPDLFSTFQIDSTQLMVGCLLYNGGYFLLLLQFGWPRLLLRWGSLLFMVAWLVWFGILFQNEFASILFIIYQLHSIEYVQYFVRCKKRRKKMNPVRFARLQVVVYVVGQHGTAVAISDECTTKRTGSMQ